MIRFAVFDEADGRLRWHGTCGDDDLALQGGAGLIAKQLPDEEAEAPPEGATIKLEGGEVVAVPPPVPTIEQLRDAKWRTIKEARTAAEDAGITVPGIGLLQTDARSREFITGARVDALVATILKRPYQLDGLLNASNEPVSVNATQVLAIGDRLSEHMSKVFKRSQTLRTRLDAATSSAEIDENDWSISTD